MIVGIDVGAKGSLCFYENNSVGFIDFSLRDYKEFLKEHKSQIVIVYVEQVHSMPKQGVASTFSFGQRLGELEGLLFGLEIPYTLIPPKVWQKECGIKAKADKKEIAQVLSKLYPLANIYGSKGGLLDGRSDALGLMHSARLKYKE